MVKELAAALLMLVLLAGAVLNVRHIDSLTASATQELRLSQADAERGDFASAEKRAEKCFHQWLDAQSYLYLFMRHDEVDTVADALCGILEALAREDANRFDAEYTWAMYCLDDIGEREHVSLESVF